MGNWDASPAKWRLGPFLFAPHWWVLIASFLLVTTTIAIGVIIALDTTPEAAQIALRTQFVGRPYEIYATIEKADCQVRGTDPESGCLTTGISAEFIVHAGVIGDDGGMWLSKAAEDDGPGPRVVIAPIPTSNSTVGRLDLPPVRASLLWAAGVDESAVGNAALVVLPEGSKDGSAYSNGRLAQIKRYLRGWTLVPVRTQSELGLALAAFDVDVIIIDHDVEDSPADGVLLSTPLGVVTWSPEQWVDFGVETATTDVSSEDVSVVIRQPDTLITGGIYGPLPEVTLEVRREARAWLFAVWLTFMVIVIGAALMLEHMRTTAAREVADAREHETLSDIISMSLFEDLDFESTRFCLWNRAFSGIALIAATMGTVAWVHATYHLTQASPVSVVWAGRNTGHFVGGMSWVSFGLGVAIVGRLWFAVRHQARFRAVFRAGNATPAAEWPSQKVVPSGSRGDGVVGVCFSGGGVRSAAFALGAIQELQDMDDLWPHVKHVSAVSGGSYIAAGHAIATKQGKAEAYRLGSDEERHLRNHTNYLAPNFFEKWRVVAEWASGMLVNIAVVCSVLWLAASLAAGTVRSAAVVPQLSFLSASNANRPWLISWDRSAPTAQDALFICIVGATLFGVLSVTRRSGNSRDVSRRVAEVFVWVALALVVLLVLVPGASLWWGDVLDVASTIPAISASLAAIAVVGWVLATLKSVLAQQQARVVVVIVGLVVPVGAVVFVSWAGWVQVGMGLWLFVGCALGAILVVAAAAFLPTARPSLHPLYREKLSSAFAWVDDKVRDEPLCDLRDIAPELTITAAANYGPSPVTPPGRSSLPYVFTGSVVGLETDGASAPGEPRPWLVDTSDVSDLYKKQTGMPLSTMDAVAISGAAVSPTMGRRTLAFYRALLAILNVRLGVWMPNPLLRHLWARVPDSEDESGDPCNRDKGGNGEADESEIRRSLEGSPRHLPWFAKEVLGQHSPIADFTYITDGGHYDNLGLLTLLRKGCRRIICFDAGGEDADRFSSIAQAMMLAEAELGIRMDFSPTPDLWPPVENDDSPPPEKKRWFKRASSADPFPEVPKPCTFVPFWYDGDPLPSALVYCKTTITVDTTWAVKDYRIRNPNFPNIPTLSQLYDDERFEAYRELGSAAASAAADTLESSSPSSGAGGAFEV